MSNREKLRNSTKNCGKIAGKKMAENWKQHRINFLKQKFLVKCEKNLKNKIKEK